MKVKDIFKATESAEFYIGILVLSGLALVFVEVSDLWILGASWGVLTILFLLSFSWLKNDIGDYCKSFAKLGLEAGLLLVALMVIGLISNDHGVAPLTLWELIGTVILTIILCVLGFISMGIIIYLLVCLITALLLKLIRNPKS